MHCLFDHFSPDNPLGSRTAGNRSCNSHVPHRRRGPRGPTGERVHYRMHTATPSGRCWWLSRLASRPFGAGGRATARRREGRP